MWPFRSLWCVDFEFRDTELGEVPFVVAMVAQNLITGETIKMFRDELLTLKWAPFDTGRDSVMVAFFASAEIGCFLSLGWPLPVNVIDLFAEHRIAINGKQFYDGRRCGNGLLDALAIRGLAHIDATEKQSMRDLIMRKRHWNAEERRQIIEYCLTDVVALIALLLKMGPTIDWPRALHRGRFMKAVGWMEHVGIPTDKELHSILVANWEPLKLGLIGEVDQAYDVYQGTVFKQAQFAAYLQAQRIPYWPKTPTGRLRLDGDTFKEQAACWPQLGPLHQLRATLNELHLTEIPIGADSRARCLLSPFQSKTSRNQPSTSKFLFSPARWIRGLAREKEGRALAYIDWASQEIGIAAGLSGDERLIDDYQSGDCYLAFAKANGLVPPDATKTSHPNERELCKTLVLGVGYGMGSATLAARAGITEIQAREILRLHRVTYPKFWRWSEDTVTTALFRGRIKSMFGWQYFIDREPNPRSLMNWPMQTHGAEAMRIAAIAATEAGIEVCCPIHDAFLISSTADRIDHDVAIMRSIMTRAGEAVANGVTIRTDVQIARYPDRYIDPRGVDMWQRVMRLLKEVQTQQLHLAA